MSDELEHLRTVLGRSAALWAGAGGVSMQPWGWTAFSGARSVDYNVAMCRGDGDDADAAVERILAEKVPAVLMLAGPGLAEAQRLIDRSWVCIGATPVMTGELTAGEPGEPGEPPRPLTRRLDDDGDVAAARALVARVFELDDALGPVALPAPGDGQQIWGAFADGELRSCLALVRVEDCVVVWSMATDAQARGLGLGRHVLRDALAAAAGDGAREVVLYASELGEPFYRRVGLRERERWQIWSRPRWVLGRA